MIDNIEILVWVPVASMLLGMVIWALLIWLVGKNAKAKIFIKKYSLLGYGWLGMAVVTFVVLVYKSLTSPLMRPVVEVAPRHERPVVEEVVEAPTNLQDLTKLAKPRDVIDKQPETPLVDKAVEQAKAK